MKKLLLQIGVEVSSEEQKIILSAKTLKKLDLVYKILDHQASNPENEEKNSSENKKDFKPKENRIRNQKNKPVSKESAKEKTEPNGNRDNRNRYKEPEYEFDAIIESEGVLDIMQDGYGFLRSSDYHYF